MNHRRGGDAPRPGRNDVEAALEGGAKESPEDRGGVSDAWMLAFCFVGLQVSYLTWGVLQERMMTKPYVTVDGSGAEDAEEFPSVTFLVAANRLLALVLAYSMVAAEAPREALARAPDGGLDWRKLLTMFAPSSLSNVLSSVFQYSALRYVTFPTQVLFKSNKIIPTMLMGKFLHSKTYSWREYGEALVISLSVALFMVNEKPRKGDGDGAAGGYAAVVGVGCLCAYLLLDSFTSQWQSRTFKAHKITQAQMMLGTNAFSMFYTIAKTAAGGEIGESLAFLSRHPLSAVHLVCFSLASSVGQLFIFYTIKRYGAVVFATIMTTRQMLSMVVSCLLYDHSIGATSFAAASAVFVVLGLRIERKRAGRAPSNR